MNKIKKNLFFIQINCFTTLFIIFILIRENYINFFKLLGFANS